MAEPGDEVRAALAELDAACDRAVAAIDAVPDPDVAFPYAEELAEKLRKLNGVAADLRARTAKRIWDRERITLATLADKIGVSTARAHQILQTAKKDREGS